MIKKINIANFKLFKESISFELASLNLLTGINGRGKSSFLQLFLLMKQTIDSNRWSNALALNGEYTLLGSFFDAKNIEVSREEPTVLELYTENYSVHYMLKGDEEDNLSFCINTCFVSDEEGNILSPMYLNETKVGTLENLLPGSFYDALVGEINLAGIHFVSAERIGPKLFYQLQSNESSLFVGPKGENAINVLFHKKSDVLDEKFINTIPELYPELDDEDIDRTVMGQTDFWLSKLFGKTSLDIQYIKEANMLTLSIANEENAEARYKPTNVGFGYTYVLPIIVAALVAKKGDILILENPEAHLHPAAQSTLAKFLALISLRGVQLFIESHSEHILNGLRVSVAYELIQKEDLNIMYFDRSYDSYYKKISLSQNGMIKEWPDNFFDQAEKDVDVLIRS